MNYPILPLRDIVVFPHMVVPLFVGRKRSVKALETSMSENKQIVLVSQINAKVEDPKKKDLYSVGTLATILQLLNVVTDFTIHAFNIGTENIATAHVVVLMF